MNQLRWMVSVFYLLMTALLLLDLTKNINQIGVQKRHCKIIQAEILSLSSLNQKKSTALSDQFKKFESEISAAGEIMHLARLNHFDVSIIKMKSDHFDDKHFFRFHLTAAGGLSDLYYFVSQMNQNNVGFRVNYFTLSKSRTNSVIDMDLSLLKYYFSSRSAQHEIPEKNWHDPFSVTLTNQNDHDAMLHSTSIEELQFAGYLQQSGKVIGIVMLPNGESYPVSINERIGSENALVIGVSAKGIRMLNNNEEKWIENKNYLSASR